MQLQTLLPLALARAQPLYAATSTMWSLRDAVPASKMGARARARSFCWSGGPDRRMGRPCASAAATVSTGSRQPSMAPYTSILPACRRERKQGTLAQLQIQKIMLAVSMHSLPPNNTDVAAFNLSGQGASGSPTPGSMGMRLRWPPSAVNSSLESNAPICRSRRVAPATATGAGGDRQRDSTRATPPGPAAPVSSSWSPADRPLMSMATRSRGLRSISGDVWLSMQDHWWRLNIRKQTPGLQGNRVSGGGGGPRTVGQSIVTLNQAAMCRSDAAACKGGLVKQALAARA